MERHKVAGNTKQNPAGAVHILHCTYSLYSLNSSRAIELRLSLIMHGRTEHISWNLIK